MDCRVEPGNDMNGVPATGKNRVNASRHQGPENYRWRD
jgi:hypothetical protein